jgi:peptidoglycan/xylan/chitin deacetylase (PgdA/CDA1 family)
MKNNLNISNRFLKYGEYVKIDNNTKEFDSRQISSLFVMDKSVFLTFDMCPTNELDVEVIEYLIENRIPATFFVNVRWFLQNKSQWDLSFLKNPLFTIGAHGYDHIDPLKQSDEEAIHDIELCLEFWSDFDIKIKWYRVPHGHPSEAVLNYFEKNGLKCASWEGPVFDKQSKYTQYHPNDAAKIYIKNSLKPGDILIMHANGEGLNTIDILKMTVDECKTRGFGFRALS